ncbi:BatD family protein [Flavobacterium antarcticum]|uniref:BatD family protein n=1 Tax=Flavobacterium antarcticum TaxID=271155 RepID=UPI0003B3A32E|nr:BatD family protein [Flavobacterium antarcticum]
MKKLLLLYVFFFSVATFAQQVEFEAKVSKTSLGLNERLRVDFSMNADGDNFTPPDFDGFRVVNGPMQQVSQSWVNGRSSFNKSYSYFLLPTRKGNVTINQASIEINGQTYKTSPVKINVGAAIDVPKNPQDAPQISANDAIHLVAEVSKVNPYINEPITVVYKLYFSYNIGITNWRELDKPKYNDFWSQNIDIKQLVVEEGNYNGERARVVTLRKTVLYPQKSGKLSIEPLSMDIDLELPTNRRNFFGQVQTTQSNKRVSAGAKTINVKALPENGKPADFTGAVGNFNFEAKPSKTTLKHGESLELKVVVSGTGNLKLFTLPKPVVPTALEMYDPVHKENVNSPLSGMTGSISDTYKVIPQYKGEYPIKPMTFSYFDLKSQRYKTISSPEIMVKVLDGPESTAAVAAQSPDEPSNKRTITANSKFEFIKLKTDLKPIKQEDFFGSSLFYGLVIFPFLCIPILMIFRSKKEARDGDVTGNRIRRSNKLVKKYLSEAKNQLQNKELFYIALEKALHNFLKAKLHIETSEMSKATIHAVLLERKADENTVSEFIKLVDNCEFARYAPSSSVAIQSDFDKAVGLISELEKQIL